LLYFPAFSSASRLSSISRPWKDTAMRTSPPRAPRGPEGGDEQIGTLLDLGDVGLGHAESFRQLGLGEVECVPDGGKAHGVAAVLEVGSTFRVLKDLIELRPVLHWTEERVRATSPCASSPRSSRPSWRPTCAPSGWATPIDDQGHLPPAGHCGSSAASAG